MAQSNVFVQPTDKDWVDAAPGVKRRMLGYNKDLMMVEVAFVEGAIGAPHSHPQVQTCYIAAGEFEVTIDSKTTNLKAGDSFMVPSNIVHGVKAVSAGTLIDAFNPYRADFI